jgi:hypothetical protein
MSSPAAFGPNFSHSKSIAASSTSASVALDSQDIPMTVIRICNKGPGEIFGPATGTAPVGLAVPDIGRKG